MQPIEHSTLRILRPDGKTVGTGFLVAPNLVVTCAHVVTDAEAVTGDTIQVQFTGKNEKIDATVLPEYWCDVDTGDIAFLRLDQILKGVAPLKLGLAEHSHPGNKFRSFGYATAARVNGIFVNGTIDGYQREYQLMQIQSPQADHGSSGGPVFDGERDVVVGMITLGHTKLGRNEQTIFATPTELLIKVCGEIQPSETYPYRSLEPFTDETAQFFFGREALVEKLVGVLKGGSHFLAVFGPSGSGKSSVVRAGLLPALKKDQVPGSEKWSQITLRPSDNPDIQQIIQSQPGTEHVVAFVDQFEELFTACPPDLRNRFVNDLVGALQNPRLVLIIAMRNEFYPEFTGKAEKLAELEPYRVDVPGTLKQDELVAIIEQPAAAVGLALEEGLTERILNDVRVEGDARSSILPLLEFTLTKLWEMRRDGWLRHDDYKAIGGVTGSLANWASDALRALTSEEEKAVSKGVLTSLVHLGDEVQDLPDTRKRCNRNEVGYSEAARRVIAHFAARHLIITDGESVELVHDALVREWAGLKDWIEADRKNLRKREDLGEAARQWEEEGKNENLLIHRDVTLQWIVEISKDSKYHLTEIEQKYLQACVAREEMEKNDQRLRLIAEEEGKERVWRLRLGISVSLLVLLIVAGALGVAFINQERAVPGQWVSIPAGSFMMGMDEAEANFAASLCLEGALNKSACSTPEDLLSWSGWQVEAGLPEFKIMDNEVTNAQYWQCIDAGACQPPKDWRMDKSSINQPAANLTWSQAGAYCNWLGGRLPTEGEWEKAARGPNNYVYAWGNTWDALKANLEHFKSGTVESILKFAQSDINAYSIKNMSGNVQEWTASDCSPDTCRKTVGQKFSNEIIAPIDAVIVRGGSWINERSEGMASQRRVNSLSNRRPEIGFRCVCPNSQTCKFPWGWVWVWFGKY